MLRDTIAPLGRLRLATAFDNKIDILRKLKQRFGGKVIRDIRFPRWLGIT